MKKEGSGSGFRRFALLELAVLFLAGSAAIAANTPEVPVPVINGDLGACSANFTVQDKAKKPIYNAKIDVVIHYGFFSLRKSELEIGTNSDGKARFIGLPDRLKKPLEFRITSGLASKTVTDDPAVNCDASYVVILGTK